MVKVFKERYNEFIDFRQLDSLKKESLFSKGKTMTNSAFFIDRNERGKKRTNTHIIGEQAVRILKELFPREWAVREYTPDYGIDLDVEFFDNLRDGTWLTRGEHVLFQVKGTEKIIKRNIKIYSRMNVEKGYQTDKSGYCEMDVVQYTIETDLLSVIEKMGTAVPVLLAVVDVENREAYIVCLNDYIEKVLIPEKVAYRNQKNVTINIPVNNRVNTDFGRSLIEWYGKRAKLYAFFNKVNYQLKELNYSSNLEYIELTDHFLRILRRLDVWSAADNFLALKDVKADIDYYLENHYTRQGDEMLRRRIESGEDIDSEIYEGTFCVGEVSFREVTLVQTLHILWDSLCNVACIFEEDAKEWYLPSYYYLSISH